MVNPGELKSGGYRGTGYSEGSKGHLDPESGLRKRHVYGKQMSSGEEPVV